MALAGDRWHPRLTPYRLCILTTTLGLGTAKAIATQKGSSVLPVTLEWISGVVLFLAFFFTGKYDSQSDNGTSAHSYWSWIYRMDCMDFVWSLFSRFGYKRPIYSSGEIELASEDEGGPAVTLYRLMVSFCVLLFGIAKATLSYHGWSTSATWIDWALGTFISAAFYCVGLYENNNTNLYPWLFEDDHSTYFHPKLKVVLHLMFISFIWLAIMCSICAWPLARLPEAAGPSAVTPSAQWDTFLGKLSAFALNLIFLVLISFEFALFVFMIASIWSEDNFSRRLTANRRLTPFKRPMMLWGQMMAKSKILRFLLSFCFLGHVVGILLMGSTGITLVGACIGLYDRTTFKEGSGISIGTFIFFCLVFGSIGISSLGMTLFAMWSFFRFFKAHMSR